MKSDRFWDELEVGVGEGGEEEEEEEEEEETTQVSNSMNPSLSYPSSYPLPSHPPMPRERKRGERRIDKKSNKRQGRVEEESKMEARRTEKCYLSLLHQWASLPPSFQQQLFFHYLLFLNHLQLILQLHCFDMFFQHSSVC